MDVKLHSKIKHRILAYYFGVWKNVFKSNRIHSLVYVDLFAGDGSCTCSQMPEELIEKYPGDCLRDWKPPYFNLMDYAKDANFNLRCIFNDWDSEQIEKLKENLKEHTDFVEKFFCADANICYPEILKLIGKPNRPSLFFLDPFYHDQLKFSTIQGIANFMDEKTGRKPELIINLMIEPMLLALKRNTEKDFNLITTSLGTDTWREQLPNYKKQGKSHILFRNVFLGQIQALGYLTSSYYVYSTETKSPQYYLIFATYNKNVHAIHKQIKPKIEALQKKEWVRKNFQIREIVNALADGRQKQLSDYTPA
ncbi:MAG: three-Cys-motif partner protein TcmP [Candidatus Altiarchaeota archaeon]|nr:three-Cys-motif partner protein TcmP [Candidatus Altiarchaeota archaeon]